MTDNEIVQWYKDTTNKSWIYPENSKIIECYSDEEEEDECIQTVLTRCNTCIHLNACFADLKKRHMNITLDELSEEESCEDYINEEEYIGG